MTCDHVGPDMDAYHYVNLPKDANTYDQQRYCKLRNCIVEAIAWYLQVLKSPDAPRNEKRTALRFVAHLVGDIHQPLHAGFAEIAAALALRCASTAGKKTCIRCGIRRSLS